MGQKWGQHFLIDKDVVKTIVDTAELCPDDTILEIGPGQGILTKSISPLVKKVVAIEIDPELCKKLETKLRDFPNVDIVNADFLKYNPTGTEIIKIVANIPYYITSPIIEKIVHLSGWNSAVIMVQNEVAKRLAAKPDTRDYGILTIATQVYADVKMVAHVSRTVFRPVPKVDSAVIKLQRLTNPLITPETESRFFSIVRASFSQRRKMLANVLSDQLKLNKNDVINLIKNLNFSDKIRPENLSIDDYLKLTKHLKT